MDPACDLERLAGRLDETVVVLGWPDERLYARVPGVSEWSPAQHVDHVLRTLEAIWTRVGTLLEASAPEVRAQARPRLLARVVLLARWIPRGRGRAPQAVHPDPRPVRHRLREALRDETRRLERWADRREDIADAAGALAHPQLGALDAGQWIRFADVHTRHHLAIVADLDRHRAAGDVAEADARELRRGEEPEYGVGAETL